MFKPGFDRVSTIVRAIAVVLFAATMLPMTGHAATSREIDYSAGLLTPADYALFGYEDYGVDSGRFVSLPQMIRDSGNPDWDDPMFAEAGIERVYTLFVHPIGGLDEHPGPDINFTSMIFVYDDEETAAESFDEFQDESDDPTATDLDGAPELGDASELTEYIDEWEEDGQTWAYHGLDFSFLMGDISATVSVNGYDDEADRDDAEAIAEYFFEKLTTLIEDGEVDGSRPPGLDLMVPRYEGVEIMASRSHYCAMDGEVLVHAYDPGADEYTQGLIDDYGLVAGYCNIQKLLIGETPDEFLMLNVEPLRFGRSSGAADYIASTIDDLTESNDSFEATELDLDELPVEVDEAWVYTYERSLGDYPVYVTELVVRDGKYVYEIRLGGFEAPELEVLIDVVSDLFYCVDDGFTTTLELPDILADFIELQAEIYADL